MVPVEVEVGTFCSSVSLRLLFLVRRRRGKKGIRQKQDGRMERKKTRLRVRNKEGRKENKQRVERKKREKEGLGGRGGETNGRQETSEEDIDDSDGRKEGRNEM